MARIPLIGDRAFTVMALFACVVSSAGLVALSGVTASTPYLIANAAITGVVLLADGHWR